VLCIGSPLFNDQSFLDRKAVVLQFRIVVKFLCVDEGRGLRFLTVTAALILSPWDKMPGITLAFKMDLIKAFFII
jgi:hypothetical protein